MTLLQCIRALERIALTQPNIRTADDGNIYDKLNANPSVLYNAFIVTQNNHMEYEDRDEYGLTLFLCDRLVDDMETNRLSIQSICKEQLGQIIRIFCEEYDIEMPEIIYTVWTQKFVDTVAGVYCTVTLELYKSECIDGDYDIYRPDIKLIQQNKIVTIKENGTVEVYPDPQYDALGKVTVITDVHDAPCPEYSFQSKNFNIITNGTTRIQVDDGFDGITGGTITVNVPTDTPCPEIKLLDMEVNKNGEYRPPVGYDGFSSFNVSVPETHCDCIEIQLTGGTIELDKYGKYCFVYNEDSDINTIIKFKGHTPQPERVVVNVTAEDHLDDLKGKALVRIKYNDTNYDQIYQGQPLVWDIPYDTEYTVSYGTVDNFNKPKNPGDFVAEDGGYREFIANYVYTGSEDPEYDYATVWIDPSSQYVHTSGDEDLLKCIDWNNTGSYSFNSIKKQYYWQFFRSGQSFYVYSCCEGIELVDITYELYGSGTPSITKGHSGATYSHANANKVQVTFRRRRQ